VTLPVDQKFQGVAGGGIEKRKMNKMLCRETTMVTFPGEKIAFNSPSTSNEGTEAHYEESAFTNGSKLRML
jgi:hypothetical protein